jgi:hypothetical protein
MANKVIYNQYPAPHQSALLLYNPGTNTWAPYASTAEANASIAPARRYIGMQAMVNTTLHHYAGGVGDVDLVPIGGAPVDNNITGVTSVDYELTFTTNGIVREGVFFAAAPGSFTIRKNGDPDTDFEIQLSATFPQLHLISMPFYNGATLEILNPTTSINYKFYIG